MPVPLRTLRDLGIFLKPVSGAATRAFKILAMNDQETLRYPIGRFQPMPQAHLRSVPRKLKLCACFRSASAPRWPASTTPSSTRPIATADGPCARWCITSPTATPTYTSASSSRSPRIGPPSSPTTKQRGRACLIAACPLIRSLVFVAGLHARLVALLESMSEEDFERGFNHPERGRMTLATNLAIYDWHSLHHTAHITSLRARMGW